jgi:hypothetical protein
MRSSLDWGSGLGSGFVSTGSFCFDGFFGLSVAIANLRCSVVLAHDGLLKKVDESVRRPFSLII